MRRFFALGIAALMAMASTAAGSINFTENWDSYTAGSAPGGPWFTDPHSSVGPLLVSSAVSLSPSNSLQVHNNATLSNRGISALITEGLNPGEVVGGTDADPLSIRNRVYFSAARSARDGSWYIELSLGDVHAPDLASLPHGTPLAEPIPVIAYTGARGDFGKNYDYFDGEKWTEAGFSHDGPGWGAAALGIDVKTNTVALFDTTGNSTASTARVYTGAFDRVNIYVTTEQGSNTAHIDDLSITGGVVVPEPATLVLLGLGAIPLLRSRRRS
jgi:hypothetical protein